MANLSYLFVLSWLSSETLRLRGSVWEVITWVLVILTLSRVFGMVRVTSTVYWTAAPCVRHVMDSAVRFYKGSFTCTLIKKLHSSTSVTPCVCALPLWVRLSGWWYVASPLGAGTCPGPAVARSLEPSACTAAACRCTSWALPAGGDKEAGAGGREG